MQEKPSTGELTQQEIENAKNKKVYTESLGYFVEDDDEPS